MKKIILVPLKVYSADIAKNYLRSKDLLGDAYGFTHNSSGSPSWYSTSLTGTPVGITPE